uniref:Uncharacterized protein n=1 Tax=Ixodes ricinus TaxID=34613 RepID=A0A6B0TYB9_IXORI
MERANCLFSCGSIFPEEAEEGFLTCRCRMVCRVLCNETVTRLSQGERSKEKRRSWTMFLSDGPLFQQSARHPNQSLHPSRVQNV